MLGVMFSLGLPQRLRLRGCLGAHRRNEAYTPGRAIRTRAARRLRESGFQNPVVKRMPAPRGPSQKWLNSVPPYDQRVQR